MKNTEKKYQKNWLQDITTKLFRTAPVPISFLFVLPFMMAISSCQSMLKDPEKPPHFDEIRQLDCNTPLSDLEVNLAKELFYSEWLETFGDPDLIVAYNLDRICVVFENEKWRVKNVFSLDGTPFPREGREVIGQAMSRSHVKVYLKDNKTPLWKTSLTHELVHASLWALSNSPDADHQGKKYSGWTKKHTELIKRTNKFMKILGL